MRVPNPDIEISSNNGVTAIRPSQNGRLKSLVRVTKDGTQRVWVFCNPAKWTWTDSDGDERVYHHQRGLTCGTSNDEAKFLVLCITELHLVHQSADFFIPLSNGEDNVGRTHDDKPLVDYLAFEQKMVRLDLPDRAALKKALSQ